MRKQTVLVLFCLFLSAMLEAQEPKSATSPTQNSIPSPRDKTQNSTRAVVIGISDYLEPLISDLKYADRDAAAFADWLRSPAGLALPDSNIRLLR